MNFPLRRLMLPEGARHFERQCAFAVLVLLVVFLVAVKPTSAQDATIFLGGELRLGMPKETVLELLAHYELRPFESHSLLVFSGNTAVGNVRFRDGRLVRVAREWNLSANPGELELASALYRLAVQLGREGHAGCVLSTLERQTPELDMRQVWFTCGPKHVKIDLFLTTPFGQGPGRVNVTEVLGEPH